MSLKAPIESVEKAYKLLEANDCLWINPNSTRQIETFARNVLSKDYKSIPNNDIRFQTAVMNVRQALIEHHYLMNTNSSYLFDYTSGQRQLPSTSSPHQKTVKINPWAKVQEFDSEPYRYFRTFTNEDARRNKQQSELDYYAELIAAAESDEATNQLSNSNDNQTAIKNRVNPRFKQINNVRKDHINPHFKLLNADNSDNGNTRRSHVNPRFNILHSDSDTIRKPHVNPHFKLLNADDAARVQHTNIPQLNAESSSIRDIDINININGSINNSSLSELKDSVSKALRQVLGKK